MQWKWHVESAGYAARMQWIKTEAGKKKIKFFMHRIINKTPLDLQTDHIDGDTLNNQRYNLRSVSAVQNAANRKSKINTSSAYKGVSLQSRKRSGLIWRAGIRANGKEINLGSFKTEEDAAMAYNFAALEAHGPFARLNVAGGTHVN